MTCTNARAREASLPTELLIDVLRIRPDSVVVAGRVDAGIVRLGDRFLVAFKSGRDGGRLNAMPVDLVVGRIQSGGRDLAEIDCGWTAEVELVGDYGSALQSSSTLGTC